MARIRSLNDIPEDKFRDLVEKARLLREANPDANPYVLGYNLILSELPCEDEDGCDLPFVVLGQEQPHV